MKRIILFTLMQFIFIANSLYAANPNAVKQFINHKDWSFVENKGQLMDEKHNVIKDVKYYSHEGGVHVFCKPGMVSFVFMKVEGDNNANISEATGLGFPLSQKARPNDLSGRRAGGFDPSKNKTSQPSKTTTSRTSSAIALATARMDHLPHGPCPHQFQPKFHHHRLRPTRIL